MAVSDETSLISSKVECMGLPETKCIMAVNTYFQQKEERSQLVKVTVQIQACSYTKQSKYYTLKIRAPLPNIKYFYHCKTIFIRKDFTSA